MAKILTIHSARNGTGKSNLVANLAVLLAQQGKRVGIVDTDISCPAIHTLFGFDETKCDGVLNDFLWGDRPVEDVAYDVGTTVKMGGGELALLSGGVYLIPSGPRIGDLASFLRRGYDLGRLGSAFHEITLRLQLDYLLIDTNPGFNEEALLSITLSDILLLIMCLDSQDYLGTAVALDLAQHLTVPEVWLVVNQVPSDYDPAAVQSQVQTTFQKPVAAALPFAPEMLLLAGQEIFCLHHADHPLTQAIQTMADRILAVEAPPRLPQPASGSEPPPTTNTMSAIVLLPDLQRRIMSWMVRQHRPLTLVEIAAHLELDPPLVSPQLQSLIEQKFIQEGDLENGLVTYRPRLAPTSGRRVGSQVWKNLEG